MKVSEQFLRCMAEEFHTTVEQCEAVLSNLEVHCLTTFEGEPVNTRLCGAIKMASYGRDKEQATVRNFYWNLGFVQLVQRGEPVEREDFFRSLKIKEPADA